VTAVQGQHYKRQTSITRLLQHLQLRGYNDDGLYETGQQFVHHPRGYFNKSITTSALHLQKYAPGSGFRLCERFLLAATLMISCF